MGDHVKPDVDVDVRIGGLHVRVMAETVDDAVLTEFALRGVVRVLQELCGGAESPDRDRATAARARTFVAPPPDPGDPR